jgi:hypothetical protein
LAASKSEPSGTRPKPKRRTAREKRIAELEADLAKTRSKRGRAYLRKLIGEAEGQ